MKKRDALALVAVFLVSGVPSPPAQGIFDAIRGGRPDVVRALVEKDVGMVKARNAAGATPLHVAVDVNDASLARYLIEKGADPNAVNTIRWTPLFYARSVETAGLLLEKGADADLTAGDITPLIQFIAAERRELVEYLLLRGSKIPDPKTPLGRLTIVRALRIGSLRYFEEGMRQGLDLRLQSEGGSLWIHYAAASDSPELIRRLAGLGLPVDRRNVFGLTPLHIAAFRGRTRVVELLIERGADRNGRTFDGKSPYNLAEEEGRAETVGFLKSLGVDQGPPRFPLLTGAYLGQPKPGKKAVLFAPGLVSGRIAFHGSIAASPDGDELFWSVGGGRDITLYRTGRVEGTWTAPEVVGPGDAPFITRDGNKLYYTAWQGTGASAREIVFSRNRTASGWSAPAPLPDVVNSLPAIHWGVSEDQNGVFYFSAGERVRFVDFRTGASAEPVAFARLKDVNAYSPFVSPDGSYLLGNIEDAGERMFILFRTKDGDWTEPIDLTEIVGVGNGFCPVVTPDGRYLFFLGPVDGVYAPYWMEASFIAALRTKALQT